jgi:hypothetical protein
MIKWDFCQQELGPLGLWGVDCPNMETAQREARHYFIQYYLDGEYDALLSEIDAQQ